MDILKKAIKNNDLVQVLRIRPFLFLMISEFFSQIAFNLQNFVLIFIIYQITRSNTAVSGVILSFTLPAIFFSVLAGVYVDRWDKRKVLFITNFIRASILLLFLIPNLPLGAIYLFTFLLAVTTQFFVPAESAVIPLLVNHNLLVSANSIFAAGIYSTILIGYVSAGPTLLLLGKNYTFIFLALLFFIGSLAVLFIPSIAKKKKNNPSSLENISASFSHEIKEVFSYIKKAAEVTQALTVLTLSQAIMLTFGVLGPGYVATILNVQVENLSWVLLAPAAIGMISGSFIIGSFGKKTKKKIMIALGFLITGIIFLFLPFGSKVASKNFIQTINSYLPNILDITILQIIVVLAFVAGIANSFIFVPANTSLQSNTNEKIRGRIYGFLNTLVGSVSLVPVIISGGLADILGVSTVITGIGVLMLMVGVFYLVFARF